MLLEFMERLGVLINTVINSPSGVVAKLRYRVHVVDRQEVSTLIVERISTEFRHEDGIEFAHVKREAQLISKDEQLPPPQYFHVERFRECPIASGVASDG